MDLPKWLDAEKIGQLALLVLAVVQYFKQGIPDKFIKYFGMAIGVAVSIICDLYVGKIVWIQSVFNGMVAAILADTAYGFLSSKQGTFTLPAKKEEGGVK